MPRKFYFYQEKRSALKKKRVHPAMLKALVAAMDEKVWWNNMCETPASYEPGFTVKTLQKAMSEDLLKKGKRQKPGSSVDQLVELTMQGILTIQNAGLWQLPEAYKTVLLQAKQGSFIFDPQNNVLYSDFSYGMKALLCDELGLLAAVPLYSDKAGERYTLTALGLIFLYVS